MIIELHKVKLGDYFDLYQPKTITSKELVSNGKYLVYGANGIIGRYDKYNHEHSEVLMTCRGATCGEINISEAKSWLNGNAMVISPKTSDLDKKFIAYALSSIDKTNIISGSAQPQITRKTLAPLEIVIPLKNGKPDLSAQKYIVGKLDQVSSLQEKIVSEISEIDALFLSVNTKEFEKIKKIKNTKRLEEVCSVVKGKFPILKTPEGKYPFVVTSERRRRANNYQFDDEAVCIPLVSSTGHGKASLHRIHYEKGKFALASIMVAIVPKDKHKILAKYLYYYFSFYKNQLLVPLMRGVANVTIPIQRVGEVIIPIPDISEQQNIVLVLDEIEKQRNRLIIQKELVGKLLKSTLNYLLQI